MFWDEGVDSNAIPRPARGQPVVHRDRSGHPLDLAHARLLCDPLTGSNFAQVNDLYPFEKVSDRARHYVSAALEHLIMWADFAAPFRFHPEQTTTFTMRPTYALARAALESAAQAVWLMDTTDPSECVRRHLRLIRWDLAEHRKSRMDVEGKDRVRRRDTELIERVVNVFTEDEIQPPRNYLDVIRWACRPDDSTLTPPRPSAFGGQPAGPHTACTGRISNSPPLKWGRSTSQDTSARSPFPTPTR